MLEIESILFSLPKKSFKVKQIQNLILNKKNAG